MADLTTRGVPAGAGKSKIRRKELEISGLQLAIEQRRVDILEKEEEIERMEGRVQELTEELHILNTQLDVARKS